VLRGALKAMSRGLPVGGSARHLLSRFQRFATAASLPLDERMTRWSGLFYDDIDELLAPDLLRSVAPIDKLHYLRRFQGSLRGLSDAQPDPVDQLNTYLLDDLLIKTDRCTMANSSRRERRFSTRH